MENKKIQDFKDLHAWQEGHSLVIAVYKITKDFPREELYSLVNQMRRAAVSVTSNIAEGFGRHSYKERANFYTIARGSLTELENQIILSKDLGYIKNDKFENLYSQLKIVQRLLCGLISKTKSFIYPNSVLRSPISVLLLLILFSMLCPLFSAPAHASTINKPINFLSINTGLVGWWTFDGKDTPWTSATAATTLDKSGNGNTGTLTNMAQATAPAQGKIGQGFKFDGVNDAVSMAANSNYAFGTGNFTISQWVYVAQQADVPAYAGLVSQYVTTGSWFTELNNDASNVLYRYGFYNGNAHIDSGVTILYGQWVNFVVAREGTGANQSKMYINGATVTNFTAAADFSATNKLWLGNINFDDYPTAYRFKGKFDDVRIYNRALSAGEVKQLYNIGAAGKVNVSPVEPLKSGLVGYWTFDGKDVVNGVALDKSGNGNNGNLINIATSTFYAQGKIGQGFKFDGSTSYVNIGDTPSLEITGNVSFGAWVNVRTFKNFGVVLQKGNGGGSASFNYAIWTYANRSITCYTANGTSANSIVYTAPANFENKWHYVFCTADGSKLHEYIDGVEAVTPVKQTVTPTANSYPFTVSQPSYVLNGSLDDVRIYNRALSAGEVIELYNIGAAGKVNVSPVEPVKSGLVGYWTFDGKDVVNGVALDKSGNGNNGNLISIATSTFYAQGKIGQGFKFDGVNDYVNVADASPLNPTNVTMSSWVKTTATGGYIVAKDSSTAGPLGPGTMASSSASGGTAGWTSGASIDSVKVENDSPAIAVVGSVKCVAPESIISTSEGNKQIKDIKIGDLVYSYNFASEKIELKKVLSVVNGPLSLDNDEWYRIYFTDGDIKATYDHPFYVNGQFIEAKDLKIGDELLDINGRRKVIQNITVEKNYTDYSWGIAVEDNHNFFANGILVHNVAIALDKYVKIIKGGNIGSTDKADATAWTSTNGYTPPAIGYYGGTSDLWGETWTAEDINASNFGVAIAAQGSGGTSNLISYYLLATNFGFTIPAGSTINGIKVEIKKGGGGTCAGICARVDYIRISVDYTSGKTNVPYSMSTVNGGEFLIKNGASTYTVDSSVSVADGKWHNMVSTYDGTSMKIFVDGVQTGIGTSFSGNLPTEAGAVRVGADYQITPANFFNGSLDDVRVYNRALSASEINKLYNLGK